MFFLAFSILLTAGNIEAYYVRFLKMPVGRNRNTFLLANSEDKPNLKLLNKILASGDTNKYVLYTRQNLNSPQIFTIDDDNSLESSYFNPELPTAILTPGWQSSLTSGFCPMVKEALLTSENLNVFLVDWRTISKLNYATAATAVPSVGRNVGAFLKYLHIKTGAPFSSMHLIGHSLGAHVSGNAGKSLNGKVARITGLDPAGPGWSHDKNRLASTDAEYVEAIHTDAVYGIQSPVADVDFYLNGGAWQPGCYTVSCNHGKSYEFFASSIAHPNRLIGKQCESLQQMNKNLCKGSELPIGGNDLKKTGSGIYRVDTKRLHLF